MMIPQQSPANVVQIATSLAQNTGPNAPAVATFAQDRAAQIRFASSLSYFMSLHKMNLLYNSVRFLVISPVAHHDFSCSTSIYNAVLYVFPWDSVTSA